MPNQTKKTTSKKTKRAPGVYVADLGTIKVKLSTAHALEQAKADFDAAGIKCITACLELSSVMPGGARAATALLACASAGDELTEAYAAVLRARDASPIPYALTPKGKSASVTQKPTREHAAWERHAKRRGPK